MNKLVDDAAHERDTAMLTDAGPWCSTCGEYRVDIPTKLCPICADNHTKAHLAAVAAIGKPRFQPWKKATA